MLSWMKFLRKRAMIAPQPDLVNIEKNVSLADFSTFRIGGNARYLARIKSPIDYFKSTQFAKNRGLTSIIIGRGSNCLFDDEGFDGLVIINEMTLIEWDESIVQAETGYPMARLAMLSARKGWGGLEFAAGIPGSVGGAIYMNAGAHGNETRDCLIGVDCFNSEGESLNLQIEDLAFDYRKSVFHEQPGLIWRARFSLQKDASALNRCRQWTRERMHSQPYKAQSAGCAFRNPAGLSAGQLIEEVGLKGARIGDAEVSNQHANYIINRGHATSKQVRELINQIKEAVLRKKAIELQLEVRLVSSAILKN